MNFKEATILDTVLLYRFGSPYSTGAVTEEATNFKDINELKHFTIKYEKNNITFSKIINDSYTIYGLGESLGGINKRGKKYKMWNTDDFLHTPEKESLYSSHPFMIFDGDNSTFGVLIDYPGLIEIDMGFTKSDLIEINIKNENFDIYIFQDDSPLKIIKKYLEITGSPYIPPKWGFGFQQSRWSYPDDKKIRQVASELRKNDIPCDAIYMDIDYMDNYKVFTVDKTKFSDIKKFSEELKADGFKLLPIIDPGVKIEKNYAVYKEGVAGKYFCVDEKSKPFTGSAWPGLVHFPDFLNAKTRKWWGDKYILLLENGVAGFWNDMNEPAIFYTPDQLNHAKKMSKTKKISNSWDYFELRDVYAGLPNRKEYYKKLCHKDDKGNIVNHSDIHNLYGYLMTKATSDAIIERYPNKRYFLLSRSSYTGLHRFAAIWMGDNQSWWEHLLVNIQMLVSLNISGFFFTGADTCGFGSNVSNELAIRWMQFGVFSPLFRNHSALGTRDQEPYSFDKQTTNRIRHFIKTRYSLLPYIYSEFISSILELKPFISPLSFYFNDNISKQTEDQFLLGGSILVAPIYKQNTNGRTVYLPESKYLYIRYFHNKPHEYQVYQPGIHHITYTHDELSFFIKENSLIVTTTPVNFVDEKPTDTITITGFVTESATITYYEDDGVTNNFRKNILSKVTFFINKKAEDFDIKYNIEECADIPLSIKNMNFIIYDAMGNEFRKTISK